MNNKSLSLYKITYEMQTLLSQLYDHETGEVNQEIQAQIDALEPTADKKCISVVNYMKSLEANKREIDYLKQELINREKAYNKEIDRLQNYLVTNMQRGNITKVECPYFTIKLKKNPYSTEIYDENLIPEKFMRSREIIKTEIKVDKVAIKEEVLKTGMQIPGAIVEQKTKLEISIDKI